MGDTSGLNALDRLILEHVAHSAAEDTDNRDGWCRWSTSDFWAWEWDDYKPLVARGLLERRETWKDILLKVTPAGWEVLCARTARIRSWTRFSPMADSAHKARQSRSKLLDLITIGLWVGAGAWLGWAGALVFLVALLIGGLGTIFNQRRYG